MRLAQMPVCVIERWFRFAVLCAALSTTGHGVAADLVRCTSADGQGSTLHRGECPSPSDTRATVTAQRGTSSVDTYQSGLAAYKAGRYSDALRILEPISTSHSKAQVLIGDMYLQGKGVARDEATALRWMQKAANLGDAQAMSLVAISLEEGAGVARSDAQALEWWRKAAGSGYGTAQTALALRLLASDQRSAAHAEGMQWLQKAAVSNESDAQLLLGAAYYEGARGLAKDRNQALHWLRAAAAQGNKEAQAAVAVIEKEYSSNSSTQGYRFRLRRR